MIKALTLAASRAFLASRTLAEPTHVMVRALAQDAKFIGDHMGGVQITLTDARTGAVLAKGLTKGGTGDTPRIMKMSRTRGMGLTDPAAAGFEAVLDLKQPTLVRVDAVGPVGKPGSATKVSSTQWILPGRDIVGDGWVLEFPGLVIEPTMTISASGALQISAKVSLMCGCPIEPGGIWNADTHKVEAHLLKGDRDIATTVLTYAGQPSQFSGALGRGPDMLVQERRTKAAALKILRKLLRNHGVHPETIVTDKLASYRAAARDLGLLDHHRSGGMRENNRAEKLASADPATGAKAIEIQIQGLRPEIPRHPCRRLQRLQSPASPDPPTDPSPVPGRGPSDLGGRDRRGVTAPPERGPCAPAESSCQYRFDGEPLSITNAL